MTCCYLCGHDAFQVQLEWHAVKSQCIYKTVIRSLYHTSSYPDNTILATWQTFNIKINATVECP